MLYSYKFKEEQDNQDLPVIREADFVIVHPSLGYLVMEVKQGDIAYYNGSWHEYKENDYQSMHKNSVDQARNAAFAILSAYREKVSNIFPLKIWYAVAFPECTRLQGEPPADLDPASIFLFDDMYHLDKKIVNLFDVKDRRDEMEAIHQLIDKILAPSFKIFSKLEDRISMFHQEAKRILTEEQERILEETTLNRRMLFLGSAGSGKTFVAMEKARQLALEGKRVLLTCYNKNLAQIEFAPLRSILTAMNFHDHIQSILSEQGFSITIPDEAEAISEFYSDTLPDMAFDYYISIPESQKFQAIVVDEGQDFKQSWLMCLESMLTKDGELYFFADPNQNLFNSDLDSLLEMPVSKHRLTKNLRNTSEINQWLNDCVPEANLKSMLKGGLPVRYFSWETPVQEKRLIESEIGRLVSQGISPRRITILSPHRLEKSSLAGLKKIKEWPLVKVGGPMHNGVQFGTIRSFKGLEADIVFLIGIKPGSQVCSNADVYVGGSRARFLLYIFHEKTWQIETKVV